jgi:hypothetical protein
MSRLSLNVSRNLSDQSFGTKIPEIDMRVFYAYHSQENQRKSREELLSELFCPFRLLLYETQEVKRGNLVEWRERGNHKVIFDRVHEHIKSNKKLQFLILRPQNPNLIYVIDREGSSENSQLEWTMKFLQVQEGPEMRIQVASGRIYNVENEGLLEHVLGEFLSSWLETYISSPFEHPQTSFRLDTDLTQLKEGRIFSHNEKRLQLKGTYTHLGAKAHLKSAKIQDYQV